MRNLLGSFLALACILPPLSGCLKKETTTTTQSETAAVPSAPAETSPPSAASAPSPVPAPTTTTDSTASTASSPPAAAPAGIATADGETPGVTVTIKEFKRASGGTLSMKLVITNGSDKKLMIDYSLGDPEHSIADYDSIGGVHLIDPVGRKKYFVARDSQSKCICSQGVKDVEPGASINVWAKFAAPPADVQKISVIVPHFAPMDDVAIGGE